MYRNIGNEGLSCLRQAAVSKILRRDKAAICATAQKPATQHTNTLLPHRYKFCPASFSNP
jgi:hypothetical protein